MDPSSTTEGAEDTKERKKIKFTVPAIISSQLDPRQVEMIRRRRPTPATLFRLADPSSPEDDSTHPCAAGENGMLKPKHNNQGVYQPPSLKAVQRMAQAHMQKLGAYTALEDPPEGNEFEEEDEEEEEEESQVSHSQSGALQGSEVAERQVPGKDQRKEDEKEGEGRERGE